MHKWILSIFIGLSIYYFINVNKFHSIVAKILLPAALIFVVFIVINQLFVYEGFESGSSDNDVIEQIKGGGGGSAGKGGKKGGGSSMMKLSKPAGKSDKDKSSSKDKSSKDKSSKDKSSNKDDIPDIIEIPEEEDTSIQDKDKSSESDKIEKKQLKTLEDIDKRLKNTSTPTSTKTTESFEDYAPYNIGDEYSKIHEPVYIDNYKLFSTIQNNLIG